MNKFQFPITGTLLSAVSFYTLLMASSTYASNLEDKTESDELSSYQASSLSSPSSPEFSHGEVNHEAVNPELTPDLFDVIENLEKQPTPPLQDIVHSYKSADPDALYPSELFWRLTCELEHTDESSFQSKKDYSQFLDDIFIKGLYSLYFYRKVDDLNYYNLYFENSPFLFFYNKIKEKTTIHKVKKKQIKKIPFGKLTVLTDLERRNFATNNRFKTDAIKEVLDRYILHANMNRLAENDLKKFRLEYQFGEYEFTKAIEKKYICKFKVMNNIFESNEKDLLKIAFKFSSTETFKYLLARDLFKRKELFTLGARIGCSDAFYQIGMKYLHGETIDSEGNDDDKKPADGSVKLDELQKKIDDVSDAQILSRALCLNGESDAAKQVLSKFEHENKSINEDKSRALAIKWLEKAAERNHVDATHYVSYAYQSEGNFQKVKECLRKAIKLGSADACTELAEFLHYEDSIANEDEIIKLYNKAIKINDNVKAHLYLGYKCHEKGKYKEALVHFNRDEIKKHPPIMSNLGIIYGKLGDIKKAKHWHTQAIVGSVKKSFLALALLLDDSENEKKETLFKKAIEYAVDDADLLYGEFLYNQKRFDEAKDHGYFDEKDSDTESDEETDDSNVTIPTKSQDSTKEKTTNQTNKPNDLFANGNDAEYNFGFISTRPSGEKPEAYIPPKLTKKQIRNLQRAKEDIDKPLHVDTKKTLFYKDVNIEIAPDVIGELKYNTHKIKQLVTYLANGEIHRANHEELKNTSNTVHSMRITKGDRFTFIIDEQDQQGHVKSIRILGAKGHYKTLKNRNKVTAFKAFEWSHLEQ